MVNMGTLSRIALNYVIYNKINKQIKQTFKKE